MPESPSSNQENTIDLAWIENVLWSVRPERSSETQQCIDQLIEQLALYNVDADQLAEQVVNWLEFQEVKGAICKEDCCSQEDHSHKDSKKAMIEEDNSIWNVFKTAVENSNASTHDASNQH